jgi:RNA polymerase sigma-70 factor (ECF subfamily)
MQAWLFRIAHNLVVDYLRQKKVKMVSVDALNLVDDNDPAGIAEIKIDFERVTKTMEKLTEEQREVIRLRFFGGLTSREAGKVLNKSDGAVREMQRAAMEKLRFLLVAG